MSRKQIFLFAALISFATFVSCLALHEYLYSFNPYSWAFPGEESDFSRSLFLKRAHLYRVVGVFSFTFALLFGGAAWLSRRSERRIKTSS